MKYTIFTPTYNRGSKLTTLYNSLLIQSEYDFEWLIVDDGSTDNTKEIVDGFINNGYFPVNYYYKANGGKHTAYNMAIQKAKGIYFFCVDSDDYLSRDALSLLNQHIIKFNDGDGIAAYKAYPNGALIGSDFPSDVEKVTSISLYTKYKCKGDYAFIYPTEKIRDFLFPVFENETFVTESVLYDQIDKKYTLTLCPRIVSICEYQPDGYSASVNKIMKNNPTGYSLYFLQRIDLAVSFRQRLVYAGKYHAFRLFSPTKLLYDGPHKVFTSLCRPVGWLFWLYYKLFRGF